MRAPDSAPLEKRIFRTPMTALYSNQTECPGSHESMENTGRWRGVQSRAILDAMCLLFSCMLLCPRYWARDVVIPHWLNNHKNITVSIVHSTYSVVVQTFLIHFPNKFYMFPSLETSYKPEAEERASKVAGYGRGKVGHRTRGQDTRRRTYFCVGPQPAACGGVWLHWAPKRQPARRCLPAHSHPLRQGDEGVA